MQPQDDLRAVGALGLDHPIESRTSAVRGRDEQDGLQAELETLREEPEPPSSSATSRQRHMDDIHRKIEAVDRLDSQPPAALLEGVASDDFALTSIEMSHTATCFRDPSTHTIPGVRTQTSVKSQPGVRAGVPDGTYADASTPLTPLTQNRVVGDNPQVGDDNVHDYTTQFGCEIGSPLTFSIDSPQDPADTNTLAAQEGSQHSPSSKPLITRSDQEIFQILDGLPKHILQYYMERKSRNASMDTNEILDDPGSVATQKHEHECSECNKSFPRRCELK